jgi:biopolymer transport protein ExbD
MNQSFSAAMLSVAVILLIIVMVSTPMYSCGLRPLELPITANPNKFGEFAKDDAIWIKHDGGKYFEWERAPDFKQYETEIRNAEAIVFHADTRLNFGIVREALYEISEYRRTGIVLSAEQQYVEIEPSTFQEYLNRRSSACKCIW